MAVTGILITNPVSGDDFDIKRTVNGLPTGQVLAKAWFTAKVQASDPDISAIVQKSITTTATAGQGQITDDGADTIGALLFTLLPADTRNIRAQANPCVYDIQIKTDLGKVYTLEEGTISALPEVTVSST